MPHDSPAATHVVHISRYARARFFILAFGLQYPLATTKAWLCATLLQWCLANFLFAPLQIGFFTVALPGLIRGKLQRLRYPPSAVGAFPFHTPMRDSAVDYLAARHARLPIAQFLLRRQGHITGDAGVTDHPTSPRSARLANIVTAAQRAAGRPSSPSVAAPPSADRIDELLCLGDAQHDADAGAAGSARSRHGRTRARARQLPRRACGATLALVTLSLVLLVPATLQGVVVDELIVVLVSLVLIAALDAASLARWCAAAVGQRVRAPTAAGVAAAIAVVAVMGFAGITVLARRAARARRAPTLVPRTRDSAAG